MNEHDARDVIVNRVLQMHGELVEHIDPESLPDLIFELWAWTTGRNTALALRLLAKELADTDVVLPMASTVRSWIKRYNWDARAEQEYRTSREWRKRRLLQKQLIAAELGADRKIEILAQDAAGDPALRRDQVNLIMHADRSIGIGTWGANQGGFADVGADEEAIAGDETLSLAERSRRMRESIVEGNSGG